MIPRIVVIGSINVDLFSQVRQHPTPGETVLGDGGRRAPGGKGANQALAARLQGAPVAMIGTVGTDPDAQIALRMLNDAGVDLSQVVTTDEAVTGLAIITVSDAGENTIVVIPGANHVIDAQRVQKQVDDLQEGDIVVLQGELPREATEAAARAAHGKNHRVIINIAPWGELDRYVLTCADPLVLNEHEARQTITSLGGEAPSPSATCDDFSTCAQWLVEQGIPSVVITLGGAGAIVANSDESAYIPGQQVAVTDTTGAGDAFVGALAARLSLGDGMFAACKYANKVGAYVVQRHGAQPSYPKAEDLR